MAQEEDQEQLEAPPFKRRKGKEPMEQQPPSEPETTLRFEFGKVSTLKQCFQCLCDSKLNPEDKAMVEVPDTHHGYKGFQMTVRNESTEVAARLSLVRTLLHNIHGSKPLLPHFMFLNSINDLVQKTSDHGRIKISRTEAPPDQQSQSHLFFQSYSTSIGQPGICAEQQNAPLITLKDDPEWFPADEMKSFCFAVLPSMNIRKMLEYLENSENDLVLMAVRFGVVNIFVGQKENGWKDTWREIKCKTEPKPKDMQYDAYFTLPHAKSMSKALSLDQEPVISFLSKPENSILMQFKVERHGDLSFLSKAIRFERKLITPAAADAEISEPGINTAKDPQPHSYAAKASRSGNDAAEAGQPSSDAARSEQPALMRRNETEPEVKLLAETPQPFIPGITISFELSESGILRQSLESLCNINLNPEFLGTVIVTTDGGFQITVQNKDTGVTAKLFFLPHMLSNFICTQPLHPHMIELGQILDSLTNTPDDDIIFISQTETPPDEESLLSFKSYIQMEDDPENQLNIPLTPLMNDHERFPDEIKFLCSTPIPSLYLDKLIQALEGTKENQIVLIVVKNGLVEMFVGPQDDWKSRWKFACNNETDQTPEMQYAAYFDLPHTESIKKALSLDPDPVIYFLSEPENHIMMEFNLQGCGHMVFLIKAIRLGLKIKIPVKDFAGEVSQPGINAAEDAAEALQPGSSATAEASQPCDAAAEPSRPSGDAAEDSRPSSDAVEASQPSSEAAEASQQGGSEVEASHPSGDAAEASQQGGNAVEASQLGGDAK